jgi:predicted RNA binding protein YcfA (HicA-like mRNA interferase family)
MPPRIRTLSAREVLRALQSFGFEVASVRGSHAKLRRTTPAGAVQVLTVPLHKELSRGTLHAIFRQACRFVPEAELGPHFFGG